MRRPPVAPSLFVKNRRRLAEQLGDSTLAVARSNDPMPQNGDAFYPFVQNANLYYLCGISQEETTLLLFPSAREKSMRELLFIRRSDPHTVIWEGKKLSKEEARQQSGIETVYYADEFESLLPSLLLEARSVALECNEHPRMGSPVLMGNERFGRDLMERFPLHHYERLAPLLTQLRMVKQTEELVELRKAQQVTAGSYRRVLSFVRPGVAEWEVEAEFSHHYTTEGSEGFAYDPIVASGERSCILHYVANAQRCEAGDLLLMDVAARWNGWNADITRTIPVSGVFSARQRAVYEAVLRVLRAAEVRLRPGVLLADYQKEVLFVVEKELIALGLIADETRPSEEERIAEVKQYFMHGTSHHLGIGVHDVCEPGAKVEAGMVFTIEPGLYLPAERIGIRLENNYLIGAKKNENLSAAIPIEPDEIEVLMAGEEVL